MVAVTAFADITPDRLADAVIASAEEAGLKAARTTGDGSAEGPVRIFASGTWTIALWPAEFHLVDVAVSQAITRRTGGRASVVHTYDDDYWVHAAVVGGNVVDTFCSVPDHFSDDRGDYDGDPVVVGSLLGVPAEVVEGYLVAVEDATGEPVHDGDEFADDEFWVFCDLWAKAGIRYPEDVEDPELTVALGPGWESAFPDNPISV